MFGGNGVPQENQPRMERRDASGLSSHASERILTMMKIICDKCEQEITDPNDISAVFEDGTAKHYHKSDCFVEARDRLVYLRSRPTEPA